MLNDTIIISLGGSLIVPYEINRQFLKSFKTLLLKNLRHNRRFFIIVGGGATARNYQKLILLQAGLRKN